MGTTGIVEPSIGAYLAYLAGFALRYFAIAGGLYAVFFVLFKARWVGSRVQTAAPPRGDVGHDIRWSLLSAATTGLSTLLVYWLVRSGHSSVYLEIGERGWPYLLFTAALCVVGYDSWMYWQHRSLHTPWLFAHVHACHHDVTNPTPFSSFAQHPIETLMGNTYFILFMVLVPVHPLAVAAAGGYMYFVALVGHLGFELYPRGFTTHRLLGWVNTSTHHNMHHSEVGCNYSVCFNLWDWLMGTNHARYHDTFEAIAARRTPTVPAPASAEGARRAA